MEDIVYLLWSDLADHIISQETMSFNSPSSLNYPFDFPQFLARLKWEDYQSLQARISPDPDLLVGLDESELRALAEGILSPSHQERLADLLQRNREDSLSENEENELDQLLAHVDSMNTLKARALHTLHQLEGKERD